MKHSLLAMLIALLCACTLHAQNREADSLALVELYCNTNGLFWTNTWDLDTLGTPPPMEEWYGVRMSNTLINGEYRVTCLDLDGQNYYSEHGEVGSNNLSGILPDLNLTELKDLYLSGNKLIGPIPDFAYMPKLEKLYLGGNQLSDSIPDFSHFDSLVILNLSNNRLVGNLIDFTNLPDLEELSLHNNGLTGEIPDFMNLDRLQILSLGAYFYNDYKSNHLTGSIPDFTNLPHLEELYLAYNGLTGSIFDFTSLPYLRTLDISYNGLSGSIPDFMNLDSLRLLDLSHNGLTDTIPHFSDLGFLDTLYLNDNNLTGTIPNFTNLSNLTQLALQQNSLTGEIPEFNGLTALTYLWLNDNSLTGVIPNFETVNLQGLNLENNSFSQDTLDLSNLASIINLDLSNCNIEGVIENLSSLNNLQFFDVSYNNLTGNIPAFNASVTYIDMSNNCLSGSVQNIAGLPFLTNLYLNDNDLNGTIDEMTFNDLIGLQELNLSNNRLDGSIPEFIETAPEPTNNTPEPESNINYLNLSGNNFGGDIPNFNLKKLEYLNLSYNNLTGAIPTFDNTISYEMSFNSMSPDSAVSHLRTLYLNNNNLTGSMTSALAILDNLRYLHLNNNLLDGCYDSDLLVLCNQLNTDHNINENISDSNNFDVPWEDFCTYQNCTATSTQDCTPPSIPSPYTSCVAHDTIILRRIYCINNGPNWGNPWNWNASVYTWDGVTFEDSCVTGLNLQERNLTGDLAEFSELTRLRVLNLASNNLTGNIYGISGLPELTNLSLNSNRLEEDIPVFDSPNLVNLNLSGNDFIGGVPTFDSLFFLEQLNLSNNNLDGTVPNFSDLTQLQELGLNDNQLKGQIPNFDSLYNLRILELGNNNLIGTIPNFPNLTVLTELHLYENQLSGQIPNFDNLDNLQKLDINNNHLTDTIPNFSNLPYITDLNASYNHLTGNIPNFNSLDSLTNLNLSDNNLTGTIPDFSSSPMMEYLELQSNNLTGTVPHFDDLQNLWRLDVSYNNLTGPVPDFNLPVLRDLLLNHNNLIGTIPNFSTLPNLGYLNLSNNILSGEIPDFNQCTLLGTLYLSSNILEGNIPNFNLPGLGGLRLNNNILTGAIPDFATSIHLGELRIQSNNLIGEIPPAFAQSAIITLVIGNNQLSGCYDPSLDSLCQQLSWTNRNGTISNGNAFTIPWETFCNGSPAVCDTFDLRITLDTTNITSCDNNDGSVSLQVNFGSPPYEYYWSDSALDTFDLDSLPEGIYTVTVTDCKDGVVVDTVELRMPSSPVIDNIEVTPAHCEEVGSFTAVVSEGMPDYQYNLDNIIIQENNPVFDNLSAGAYMLYVTDMLNCIDSTSVQIEGSAIPEIQAIAPLSTCQDEAQGGFTIDIVSEGTAPYQYSIDGNFESNNVFSDLAPGNYIITVQDSLGCENTTTTEIIALPLPQIQMIDTISACGGAEGEISIEADGGTAPFNYMLNGTLQEVAIFTGLTSDTYNITVEDANGCTTNDQVILAQLTPLAMNNIVTDAKCQALNGELNIEINGGTPNYEYSLDNDTWQDDTGFINLQGDSTYTVYVRDSIGCKTQSTAELNDTPLAIIDTTAVVQSICEAATGSIALTAHSGTSDFEYSIDGVTYQSNANFGSLPGYTTYEVFLRDEEGCLDSMDIYIDDTPRVDFDTIYIDPHCGQENGSIEIGVMSGTHPYTYDFNGGVNGISSAGGLTDNFIDFTDLPGGDYFITVTDDVGCQEDTLVSLAISNILSINIDTINEPCIGDDNCGEIRINLSGWNNPYVADLGISDDSTFCVPVDTTFFIITDNDNCEHEEYIYFPPYEYQESIIPESAELRIGEMEYFQIINAGKADWYSEDDLNLDNLDFDDNNLRLNATFTAPPYTDNNNGCTQNITYKIVAYNEAGNCKDTLILPIRVLNEIKIPPGITPNGDGINDILEIPFFDIYGNARFAIFNRWGDEVYQFRHEGGNSYNGNEWDGTYHKNGLSTGRKLPDGDYFYTLQFGNCPKIQKGKIFIR